jgi:hypothetical protein
MPADTLAILRRTSFLTGVAEEPLRLLAQHLTTESFPADSVVFAQGSRPGAFFILAEGRVDLWRTSDGAKRASREVRLASLVPGDLSVRWKSNRSPCQVSARFRTAVRACASAAPTEFPTTPRFCDASRRRRILRQPGSACAPVGWAAMRLCTRLLRRHPIFLARPPCSLPCSWA